jgi:hypothetical protein
MAVQNDEETTVKKNGETAIKEEQKTNGDKVLNDKKDEKVENEEKEDDDLEDDKDDLEDDKEDNVNLYNANIGKKSFLGSTCTVKTLIDDNVLIPENNALSFEFMVCKMIMFCCKKL